MNYHYQEAPSSEGPKNSQVQCVMVSRNTKQNQAIRRVLDEVRRPLSPAEVLALADRHAPGLGIATVYRVLKRLVEDGDAVAVQLPGEPPRYEGRRAAEHHHHHFRCEDCGKVFDIPGCPEGLAALTPPGFRLSGHELVLYGQCGSCTGAGGGEG
jgi:Fur family transcriptional regulator, ferric uptake regulator